MNTPLNFTETNGVLRAERDGIEYLIEPDTQHNNNYYLLQVANLPKAIVWGCTQAQGHAQIFANAITKAGEEKSAALERTEEAWKKAEARLMELGDYYTALDEPQTVLEIRISTLEATVTELMKALQLIRDYRPKQEDCDPTIPDDPYIQMARGCKRIAYEALNKLEAA